MSHQMAVQEEEGVEKVVSDELDYRACRRCPNPCGGKKAPLGWQGKNHKKRVCISLYDGAAGSGGG